MLVNNLYENNYSDSLPEWVEILKSLDDKYNDDYLDNEVWEIARQSENIPYIGNIYQEIVLNKISEYVEDMDLDLYVNYFVNSNDTHLFIDNTEIYNLDDFKEIIENKQQELEQENHMAI